MIKRIDHCFVSTLLTPVTHGFLTREQGDGTDNKKVELFIKSKYANCKSTQFIHQVHGNTVYVVQGDTALIPDADALVTKLSHTVLVVRTADCVPLVFSDPEAGVIGIAHCGWKGTVLKLQQKTISQMTSLGARKDFIRVAIGPSINSCCYTVNSERLQQCISAVGLSSVRGIIRSADGNGRLNLVQINYDLLLESGVQSKHIDYFPFCTSCDTNTFFSYRREKDRLSGEQFSFIVQ